MARRSKETALERVSVSKTPVSTSKTEKRAQKRAVEQEQENRTWDRAAEVAKVALANPFLGEIVKVLAAGAGGVLAHEPLTIRLVDGPTAVEALQKYGAGAGLYEGTPKLIRWRVDYEITNAATRLLTVELPSLTLPGGIVFAGFKWGYPSTFTVTVDHSRPLPPNSEDYGRREIEEIRASSEKKLTAFLRAMGFAVGAGSVLVLPAVAQTVSKVIPG